MFCRTKENYDYPLKGSTWAYPYTGFWLSHAIGILGIGYLGYLMGKNIRD